MTFYYNGKKITELDAMELVGPQKLTEYTKAYSTMKFQDPLAECRWDIGGGNTLEIDY